jgi:LuxR family maltose regulon positive regulatory protein
VLRQHGEWEQARQHYFAILDRPDDQAFSIRSVHAFGALADLELLQGNLRTANTYWQKALAAIRSPANFGVLPLPTISWVYIRMAELLYEWNQLQEAREHLEQGLERVDLSGDSRTMIAAYLMAGRLKLVDGAFDDVTGFVDRARAIIETADFPDWKTRLDRLQVDFWLAQGRSDLARRWLTSAPGSDEVGGGADSVVNQLTRIKVIILAEDRGLFDQAGSDLRALLGSVAGQGLTSTMIEGRALLALLHWQRGDHAAALVELQRSMVLAEPEGYAAVYADMGLSMAMLLQEAGARRVMPAYIDHLLQAFRSRAIVVPPGRALPEPLSPREAEILEFLASGLSNREIAATMFISAETVKKHVANIYSKLDAHSRIDALVRARELGLVN